MICARWACRSRQGTVAEVKGVEARAGAARAAAMAAAVKVAEKVVAVKEAVV